MYLNSLAYRTAQHGECPFPRWELSVPRSLMGTENGKLWPTMCSSIDVKRETHPNIMHQQHCLQVSSSMVWWVPAAIHGASCFKVFPHATASSQVSPDLLLLDGWMDERVLGHLFALSRLTWAGDNLD